MDRLDLLVAGGALGHHRLRVARRRRSGRGGPGGGLRRRDLGLQLADVAGLQSPQGDKAQDHGSRRQSRQQPPLAEQGDHAVAPAPTGSSAQAWAWAPAASSRRIQPMPNTANPSRLR